MKAAVILSFVAAALAGAVQPRAGHCGGDNCARAVTGTRDGLKPVESRKADCTKFMQTTVVPEPVTTTVTVTVDGEAPHKLRRDILEYRDATDAPAVPAYATACADGSKYSSACSCWGITAVVTTAPTPTKTTTVTVTGDYCEDLFARAWQRRQDGPRRAASLVSATARRPLQPAPLVVAALAHPPPPAHLAHHILHQHDPVSLLAAVCRRAPTHRAGPLLRVLVFKAPGHGARKVNADSDTAVPEQQQPLRPLHIEIHGGSFIGGLPESNAAFDARVAAETGAVVVSLSYRYAPEHVFPAAIDDVDAAIAWIAAHAARRWGADPELMTVGGFSAGGNLAVASTQQCDRQPPSPTRVRGIVTFYAALDLRLSPDEKPRPPGFPTSDPLSVLVPLFDAYMAGARRAHIDDARLSPVLARRETLPERILLVVPAVDILYAEQMAFAERVNHEDEREGRSGRVETMVVDGMFHGYLEVPDAVVKREVKDQAFGRGVAFLQETYALHGWSWRGA
ncbi:hypothetical protein ACCO45_004737 [Purpureocillium lilacinum]|uniref:Uncharacterized protein n=1 Tax=Purpureocillium lilacinum TaxID=33203 RepID=A0ACC4DTD8_PURLI